MSPFPRVLSSRIRDANSPVVISQHVKAALARLACIRKQARLSGYEIRRKSAEHRRACLRGCFSLCASVSRIFVVVDPPSLPSGCIRGAPFPAGLHRRQPRPISIKRKSKELEETRRTRGKKRRKREDSDIVLKYVCFYLVCADIYRYFKDIVRATEGSTQDWIRRIDNKQSRTRRGAISYLPVQNFFRIAAFRLSGRKEFRR